MPAAAPKTVLLSGADGEFGRRVRRRLDDSSDIRLRLIDPDADSEGAADVVVHLASGDHDARAFRRQSVTEGAVAVLDRAAASGARHVVFVSSAMVYGAYPNNPIPLTEEAVLRPDVEFVFARQLATAEALVDRWRRQVPGRTTTVLRPVVTMDATESSTLARALASGFGQRFGEDDPPAQFVHLDDVVSAVTLGVEQRLDGVFNVAPDGWVAGERVRELSGSGWKLKLPERVSEVWSALRWRFQRGPIPPGLRPYTRSPWLVANDRLKASGWLPTVTNEQAYVEGTEAKWWTMITPKRRQELSLGAMVLGIAAGALAGLSLLHRWRRSR
ncbi:MAG: NAD-dependent epimerase/dehydratase family protein [Actinomycetota bacterium]|nr:NAD-dependent epimerase/dehydratase family protein [Actinomycetota bacterium]